MRFRDLTRDEIRSMRARIISCTACAMTMYVGSPNVKVDDESEQGDLYCARCAKEREEEKK